MLVESGSFALVSFARCVLGAKTVSAGQSDLSTHLLNTNLTY